MKFQPRCEPKVELLAHVFGGPVTHVYASDGVASVMRPVYADLTDEPDVRAFLLEEGELDLQDFWAGVRRERRGRVRRKSGRVSAKWRTPTR